MYDTDNSNTVNTITPITPQHDRRTPTEDVVQAGIEIGMLRERLRDATEAIRSAERELVHAGVPVPIMSDADHTDTEMVVQETPPLYARIAFLVKRSRMLSVALTREREVRKSAAVSSSELSGDLEARDKLIEGYTTEIDRISAKVVDLESTVEFIQAHMPALMPEFDDKTIAEKFDTLHICDYVRMAVGHAVMKRKEIEERVEAQRDMIDAADKVLTEAAYQYDRAKVTNPDGGPELGGLPLAEKVRAFGRWLDARYMSARDDERKQQNGASKQQALAELNTREAKASGEFAIELIAAFAPTATRFTLAEIRDMDESRREDIVRRIRSGVELDRENQREFSKVREIIVKAFQDSGAGSRVTAQETAELALDLATGWTNLRSRVDVSEAAGRAHADKLEELRERMVAAEKTASTKATSLAIANDVIDKRDAVIAMARATIMEMLKYAADRVTGAERDARLKHENIEDLRRDQQWRDCLIPVSATLKEIAEKHGFKPSET